MSVKLGGKAMTAAEAHTALQISRVTSTFKVLSTHAACGAISFRTFFHDNDADTTTAEHAKKGRPFSPLLFVVGAECFEVPIEKKEACSITG